MDNHVYSLVYSLIAGAAGAFSSVIGKVFYRLPFISSKFLYHGIFGYKLGGYSLH